MGPRYGNRASAEAAGALCCDNRGFAGGDTHSIMNNRPLQRTQTRIYTHVHLHAHTHTR